MGGELQLAAVAAVRQALPDATVHGESWAAPWLMRPGRHECGPRWDLVRSIYAGLAKLELPDNMPPRERRRIDAVIEEPGEAPRLFEFDESQHFNAHRAMTLRAYGPDVETAFPHELWLHVSAEVTKKLSTTGNWGGPKRPLFPEPGGRHLQRAFRDALADLLPAIHGWAPTLRIADFEVEGWIYEPDAAARMSRLLRERL
jgi:hypothetical protein